MPRLNALGLCERVVRRAICPVDRGGFKQKPDVVAEVKPVKHPPDEPVRALLQDRQPGRARLPRAAGELVHHVTGVATEQPNQRIGLPRHEMHGQLRRAHRYPVGVVAPGQAGQKARGVDAALAAEPNQATSQLVAGPNSDDKHRILELPDKRPEGAADVHSDQPTGAVGVASPRRGVQQAPGWRRLHHVAPASPALSLGTLGSLNKVEHILTGKVRDLYSVDGDVLLVASDRISVYDVVLPTPIPDKGALLTQLSAWWFGKLRNVIPNHLISITDVPPDFGNSAMRCTALRMIPVECIARGYLAGLGLREYERSGTVSGVVLPAGLVAGSRLPEPIFTPTTKFSDTGHDEFITLDDVTREIGAETAKRLRETTLELYTAAAEHALENGIIIADTKFEFGWDPGGQLTLGDEAVTSDSSRFWLAEKWRPGQQQYFLDKQFVRDWAVSTGWDREPPGPVIPPAIVAETRRRYVEAYERITGVSWSS